MRKDFLLPGLALVGGAAGFVLRRWQLATAYDPDTMLFTRGAFSSYALLSLLACLAVLFLVLGWGGARPASFSTAYRNPTIAHMSAMAASAFFSLGASMAMAFVGMKEFFKWRIDPESVLLTYPVSLLLCAALCLPAGMALLFMGRESYQNLTFAGTSLLSPFPSLACLLWLFSFHLSHGTDPILMYYGLSLGTPAFLVLAHYYTAAFFFERVRPTRATFCALMGVCLGLTSLADSPTLPHMMLTLSFSLSALSNVHSLLRSRFGPPWPKRLAPRGQPARQVSRTTRSPKNLS